MVPAPQTLAAPPSVMQAQNIQHQVGKQGESYIFCHNSQFVTMSETVTTIDIQGKLPKVASGKVRDLFAVDDDTLLFVASDRISAYDVIMENVSRKFRTTSESARIA